MRNTMMGLCLVAAAALPASTVVVPTAEAVAGAGTVTPCSRGLVALTFDDGPRPDVTARVLDLLVRDRVPATFFVVGQRVAAYPGLVRRMHARGFTIGNHSYRHEMLTRLSPRRVAESLRRTRRAIAATGATPSPLMRPPYGAIDATVRRVAHDLGMVPVMWDVDPRDWEPRSSATIAGSVLRQLRAGRDNVVLLHDGVGNSPSTLRALPAIVRGARTRGYCFADLDRRGRPTPPVPAVRVQPTGVDEGDPGQRRFLRFGVGLSQPTSRATSVRVRTVTGSASPSRDYLPRDLRLRFPVGVTRRTVAVRVEPDRLDEPTERVRLRLSAPVGMSIRRGQAPGRILDDDPPPTVSVGDAAVTEPAAGHAAPVAVAVRLDRSSGRRISVWVETVAATAAEGQEFEAARRLLSIRPGRRLAAFAVTVLGDDAVEDVEHFDVRITEVRHARVARQTGTVTIRPPQTG